jgi:hypothetical protein
MTTYTIPIPEPRIPGNLKQLAQITVPGGGIIQTFWMRETRQVVIEYAGRWFIQSDQNILSGVAQIIGYTKPVDLLVMTNLVVFEIVGDEGYKADKELQDNFRDCDWSDYATDLMAFQCNISEKNA